MALKYGQIHIKFYNIIMYKKCIIIINKQMIDKSISVIRLTNTGTLFK